jgi:F420H(2)-dependent quinone reductase
MGPYANYLRWLYRGGRPNVFARVQNRASARLFAVGIIMPDRCAELQVRGRRSGEIVSFPVVIATYKDGRYLVSMLGEANWVRNVRAAHGAAVLVHGRREQVCLEEVTGPERAPILRKYLQVAPGARPHIPVARRAPLADFERISPDYPVFRIGAAPA